MKTLEQLKKLGEEVLDLVFPISCLICGHEGVYLCDSCLAKLPRLEKQICVVCYKPSAYGKTHPTCVSRNTVDGSIAALTYKDIGVRKIIEVFKYNFVSDLAKPLSKLIVEAMERQGLADYFDGFLIVPVPLHSRRLNWRGFNQSEFLSRALSEKLKMPIEKNLIKRQKNTKPQVELNAEERKRNLENAFELSAEISGQKILMVDDLMTSGATANEIAKLLKKQKAAEVWVLCAAHG